MAKEEERDYCKRRPSLAKAEERDYCKRRPSWRRNTSVREGQGREKRPLL